MSFLSVEEEIIEVIHERAKLQGNDVSRGRGQGEVRAVVVGRNYPSGVRVDAVEERQLCCDRETGYIGSASASQNVEHRDAVGPAAVVVSRIIEPSVAEINAVRVIFPGSVLEVQERDFEQERNCAAGESVAIRVEDRVRVDGDGIVEVGRARAARSDKNIGTVGDNGAGCGEGAAAGSWIDLKATHKQGRKIERFGEMDDEIAAIDQTEA